jgi:hypothetical protein
MENLTNYELDRIIVALRFFAASGGGMGDLEIAEIEAIADKLEGLAAERLNDEPPEPCTAKANAGGCTCRMSPVNSASIDPPEPIIDGWCPLHGGRDPDAERDEQLEREADARAHPEWNED